MKLTELINLWLDEKKRDLKESTFTLYKYEMNQYIIPIIGNLNIRKNKSNDIQNIISKWNSYLLQENRLNNSTKNNLTVLVNQIYKFAIQRKFIKENSVKMKNHKTVVNSLNILEFAEYEKMHTILLNNITNKNAGILICMSTGIRIGELCALQWRDVNFDEGLLYISKTMQRIYINHESKIIISSPKTKKSLRTIPLTVELINILRKLSNHNPEDYILTNSKKIYEPRSFRRYYATFCKKNSINGYHVHTLRHTFATKLIQNGVDPKTVSELMGHSNIKITLDLYVHPTLEQKRKCLNRLFI